LSRQHASLVILINTILLPLAIEIVIHTLDSKSLSRACLSISKNCAIVPLDAGIDHWLADTFENLVLRHLLSRHKIERELLSIFGVKHKNLIVPNFPDAAPLLRIC